MTAVALGTALASPISGCGKQEDRGEGASAVSRSSVLMRGNVAGLPPGSPERALAAWWRSLHMADVRGAERLLPRQGGSRLAQFLPALFIVIKPVRLRLMEVQRTGSRAVVYTELVVIRPIGRRRSLERASFPQAFPMVRGREGWRLGDSFFFERVAGRLLSSSHTGT